jgi:hypothetical protein
MTHKKAPAELVVDLIVPASIASRYRARLIALTRLDAQLRLPFCPSLFRSGVSSCPAVIWLVSGDLFAPLRGVVGFQAGAKEALGVIHFDQPLERRDFDALLRVCQPEDAVFGGNDEIGSNASAGSAETLPVQSEDRVTTPSAPLLH